MMMRMIRCHSHSHSLWFAHCDALVFKMGLSPAAACARPRADEIGKSSSSLSTSQHQEHQHRHLGHRCCCCLDLVVRCHRFINWFVFLLPFARATIQWGSLVCKIYMEYTVIYINITILYALIILSYVFTEPNILMCNYRVCTLAMRLVRSLLFS